MKTLIVSFKSVKGTPAGRCEQKNVVVYSGKRMITRWSHLLDGNSDNELNLDIIEANRIYFYFAETKKLWKLSQDALTHFRAKGKTNVTVFGCKHKLDEKRSFVHGLNMSFTDCSCGGTEELGEVMENLLNK